MNACFWGLDSLYLAAGIVLIVVAEVFRMSDGSGSSLGKMTLRRLVVSDSDLTGGIVLGVMFLISFLFSIPGYITSKGHDERGATTKGLATFAWTLVVTVLTNIVVGSAIWFFTLRERNEFYSVWLKQPAATQAFLQDSLQCCGYWNATAAGSFTVNTGFCANVQNVTADPCVTPITSFADTLLNDIFSTIFGFMAVQVLLFLCTICVINDRHEEERFRKIDEKRGVRGGFV